MNNYNFDFVSAFPFPTPLIINKFAIDELIIFSFNVRGLSTNLKRREKKKECSFCKTFAAPTKKNDCSHQNGASQLFLAVPLAQALGYAFCLTATFNTTSRSNFFYPEGRFILVDLKLGNKIMTLRNIYRPNEDSPNLKKKMFLATSSILSARRLFWVAILM